MEFTELTMAEIAELGEKIQYDYDCPTPIKATGLQLQIAALRLSIYLSTEALKKETELQQLSQ